MQIWVDAAACPQVIKEILFRAAERTQVLARTPSSPYLRTMRVAKGFDGADQRIVQGVQPGDLVVTADLPLAAEVVARARRPSTPAASSTRRTLSASGSRCET